MSASCRRRCLPKSATRWSASTSTQAKVERLNQGLVPIFEPGLESLVKENHAAGRIKFTTDAAAAVEHGEIQFIAVGTPPDEDGSADLQIRAGGRRDHRPRHGRAQDRRRQVDRAGRHRDKVKARIAETLKKRGREDLAFDVVSNPEFLKEGAAVADCMRPDRIIVGTDERGHRGGDARALRAVQPQPRQDDRDGRALRRTHQIRRQLHAGDQDQLHERDGQPGRAARRRHRGGAQGHRQRPAHRLPLHLSGRSAMAARAFPRT